MGRGQRQSVHPSIHDLQEAEGHQQRGERRAGQDAITCFEKAAVCFQRALEAGLPSHEQQQQALAGLAEVLQQAAGAIVQVACSAPDDQCNPQLEDAARAQAAGLYAKSVETYIQIRNQGGKLPPDVGVNSANTLCAWAELLLAMVDPSTHPQLLDQSHAAVKHLTSVVQLPPYSSSNAFASQAMQQTQQTHSQAVGVHSSGLLDVACGLYSTALQQEEDALTYSNLGDALMTWAQVLDECGNGSAAQQAVEAALSAYQASCSLTDSGDGDDLPGLLCNWGMGLTAAGQRNQLQPDVRLSLLSQAEARLTSAAEFMRGDPAPLIGLGDALTAKAELLQANSKAGEAAQVLQSALDHGYGAALRLQRDHPEARVGAAEAHMALGRLAAALPDASSASQHLQQACILFEGALRLPEKIGGFKERCEVRYNYVCCLALSGRDQEASTLLSQLLACGANTQREVLQDTDLAHKPWLQQVLASVSAQMPSTPT